MVVMVVRDHDDVDMRQLQRAGTGATTRFGPAKLTGDARSEVRIGQDTAPAHAQQHGGVPHPGYRRIGD